MAQSPGHRFGQIIGDLLEAMLYEPLKEIAEKHKLYLDYKHPRPTRNNNHKLSWTDHKGNVHDLDYVLERGGSEERLGNPTAFVETAWRRYTKHSRNKVQEIQGAIGPLAETYRKYYPFLGVVLAGVFTQGSLQQLASHGFSILFYSYDDICKAFEAVGINAAFDENTSDKVLQRKVKAYEALNDVQKQKIIATLKDLRSNELKEFLASLEVSLGRKIAKISVVSLHGSATLFGEVSDAVSFIESYDERQAVAGFLRYELNVEYSNGDKINADFGEKRTAIEFLRGLH